MLVTVLGLSVAVSALLSAIFGPEFLRTPGMRGATISSEEVLSESLSSEPTDVSSVE